MRSSSGSSPWTAGESGSPGASSLRRRRRGWCAFGTGQVEISEGAFLGTDGGLLGFDLLECRDMEEAVEVVAAHPLAKRHVLELRPVYA